MFRIWKPTINNIHISEIFCRICLNKNISPTSRHLSRVYVSFMKISGRPLISGRGVISGSRGGEKGGVGWYFRRFHGSTVLAQRQPAISFVSYPRRYCKRLSWNACRFNLCVCCKNVWKRMLCEFNLSVFVCTYVL